MAGEDLTLVPIESEPSNYWLSPPFVSYDRILVPPEGLRCILQAQSGQKQVCWFKRLDSVGREVWVAIAHGRSDVKIHLESILSITLADAQYPIPVALESGGLIEDQQDLQAYRAGTTDVHILINTPGADWNTGIAGPKRGNKWGNRMYLINLKTIKYHMVKNMIQ